jgi:hypothetical protein
VLDGKVPVVEEYYRREDVWSKESLERWEKLKPMIGEYRVRLAGGPGERAKLA